MNSSMTISLPALPNFLSSMIVLTPAFASSRSLQMRTPLPSARPSALRTIGNFACVSRYSMALSGSVKISYSAVGIPYFFIRFFEKALLPSMIAAFFLVPKTRSPFASRLSTRPAQSGSSWLQTTMSMPCSFANAACASKSMTPIGTHSAISAMPALPGAQ